MTNAELPLTAEQEQILTNHGLTNAEVRRQWSLLTGNPLKLVLSRPATIGDGVVKLQEDELEALKQRHRQAAAAGRWQKFIPASGAASRMFALKTPEDRAAFCQAIEKFAFSPQLLKALEDQGVDAGQIDPETDFDAVRTALLSEEGLGYGETPKGLVKFHAYDSGPRSAFEEHLREAAQCLVKEDGSVQAHFTVGEQSQQDFEKELQQFTSQNGAPPCKVSFSLQQPSTDTIAMNESGGLLLDDEGAPVRRPGGHGALIENLNAVQGDLLLVKNVDNITHEAVRTDSIHWIEITGGYLLRLQEAISEHIKNLKANTAGAVTAAVAFVRETFPGAVLPEDASEDSLRTAVLQQLERPLRVCGMVKNEGEPGGGPFWTQAADGSESLQIVESAELDKEDRQQQDIFASGTHFNPVFMALGVRDPDGQPYDLTAFVDQSRFIKARKPYGGQTASVLERPGLWNGGMAGWNTVFVEVPTSTFCPAKTVLDLLRPEHQPA